MDNKEQKLKEKKALLLKKKKLEKLREKKALEASKKQKTQTKIKTEDDRIKSLSITNEEERLQIAKELKTNAIASFARYDFYKDGYKKTLGILIFTFLTVLVSSYALFYSSFLYKPTNAYLPVDPKGYVFEPSSLRKAIHSEAEIIDFASEAYRKISNYNYVNLQTGYISGLRDFYTDGTLAKYKSKFLSGNEVLYVKENFFIVESVIFKGARIDEEESRELSKKAGVRAWVVKLTATKIYQAEKKYVRKDVDVYMKIMRVSNEKNYKGIAVQSFVEEER